MLRPLIQMVQNQNQTVLFYLNMQLSEPASHYFWVICNLINCIPWLQNVVSTQTHKTAHKHKGTMKDAHTHTPLPIRDSSSNKSTPQGRAHISSGRGGVKVEAPRTCSFLSLPGFQRARRTLFTGHQVSLGSLWTGGSWLAFRARLVKLI